MKTDFRRIRAFIGAAGILFGLFGPLIGETSAVDMAPKNGVEPGGGGLDVEMAVFQTDEFAWRLFLWLNTQADLDASPGSQRPGASPIAYDPDTPVVWETWALATSEGKPDSEIFREHGTPPLPWGAWNRTPKTKPSLEPVKSSECTSCLVMADGQPAKESFAEIRMNRPAYDFIRDHGLYSREGLASAYAAAVSTRTPGIIQFPRAAKVIKAQWIKLEDTPRSRAAYHWRTIGGAMYGLAALHITTKDLPMWFWADFVHVDVVSGEPYASFKDATTQIKSSPAGNMGIRAETTGTKWEYYRLKGTQINFVDELGRPTVLGNRLLDSPAVSSSCITCHAAARVDRNGYGNQVGANAGPGLPEPQWFWKPGPPIDFSRQLYIQTDFVYSLPRLAQSAATKLP